MLRSLSVLIFILLTFSSMSWAKEFRLVQVDKTFMGDISDKTAAEAFDNPEIEDENKVIEFKAKVGDKIQFVNRDEVSHNVSGTVNSKVSFNVKLQEPGAKNDRKIELTEKGEYSIQCAIHPKMLIKVKVD